MTKTMMKKLKFIPKKKQHSTLKTVLVSLLITSSFYTTAEIIPSEQVIKDITYLASDDLKGRASFSPEIDKAANYIAKRFAEIGLQPLHSESFLQTFTVSQIQPNTLSVNLNDMRTALRELNQQGGQHLIVIDNSHKKTFKAYQGYFNRGLTKLSLEHSGALVLVLRDDNSVESKIEQYKVSASATITQQTLTNVVGVLPGKQSPEDIVLYSSHYDHLGVTEDGKQIYNGADDDASGTTAVLNLAQFFANKGDNKRSLMFSAFTAEEIGGFGSKYFSQQLNPDHVVAMINIEMIGKPSKFGAGTIWMTGMERSNLGELLNKNLVEINTKIYQDPYPEQGLFYRSDNATLARLGVPAHSFSSTQLDKDQHYHKVTDDINSLDLSSMHKVIETLATATQPLVDGLATPTRIDKAQVRSTGKIY
jgi:aminopeptidase YwaD